MTGTLTKPKLIAPLQIARAMVRLCIADGRFGQDLIVVLLALRGGRWDTLAAAEVTPTEGDQMRRRATMAVGAVAAIAATAVVGIGAATAAAPKPAKTVTGSLITVQPGTLKPGTKLSGSAVGFPRVFVNAKTGWALATAQQAQYAAVTTNGGKTWRTASPALHLNAARRRWSVTQIGARQPKVAYAFGGGQVADVTSDGGKHWYRALFDGTDMAVVPGFGPAAADVRRRRLSSSGPSGPSGSTPRPTAARPGSSRPGS